MQAGIATKWSDRIFMRVDPVTPRCYAPGFHDGSTKPKLPLAPNKVPAQFLQVGLRFDYR